MADFRDPNSKRKFAFKYILSEFNHCVKKFGEFYVHTRALLWTACDALSRLELFHSAPQSVTKNVCVSSLEYCLLKYPLLVV
jgi:hypothetical protein